MVHIWHTEEPKPDKEGLHQTKTPFTGRPTAIGLLWSRLASFGLAWKSLIGLENRRPFTRSKGGLPLVADTRPATPAPPCANPFPSARVPTRPAVSSDAVESARPPERRDSNPATRSPLAGWSPARRRALFYCLL